MDNNTSIRTSAALKLDQASALIRAAQEEITWLEGKGWADLYDLLGGLHGEILPLASSRVASLEITGIASE